jgi:membrane protease YdiL (CAAX protease family)
MEDISHLRIIMDKFTRERKAPIWVNYALYTPAGNGIVSVATMKHFFKKVYCGHCGEAMDPTLMVCPHCGEQGPYFEEAKAFKHHVHCGWVKQLASFLIGWAGFQVAGLIVEIIMLAIYRSLNTGVTPTEATAWLEEPWPSLGLNAACYTLVLAGLIATQWSSRKELLKPFKNGLTYAFGAAGGVALLLSSILWGVIAQAFWPGTTANANQTALTSMIKTSPVLCVFLLCFMAPIAEEITYRVGLFGFLKRWNVYAAYIIAPIVFGLIHFGWTKIGTDGIYNELIQIPSYIFAGVGFALLYDFCGFGASTLAHITNNLISVLVMIYSIYQK